MSKKKKLQYCIYPRLSNYATELFRKQFSDSKKTTDSEVLSAVFKEMPWFIQTLDSFIWAEERYHKINGNRIIFPANTELLDLFWTSDFSLEDMKGFNLPFNSFVLAIPKGYQIDGFSIPSCQITWCKYRESEYEIYYPFFNSIDFQHKREISHQKSSSDEMQLSIVIKDPEIENAYQRMLIFGSSLQPILKVKTLSEFHEIVGSYGESSMVGIIPASEYDQEIQYRLVKIIAALSVYNLSTGGTLLADGFPSGMDLNIEGKHPKQQLRMYTLKDRP